MRKRIGIVNHGHKACELPLPIPFQEGKWGQVQYWEAPVPGVYMVETAEGSRVYIVDRSRGDGAIPERIDQYGVPDGKGAFTYFGYAHGELVIEYEILRYLWKTEEGDRRDQLEQELDLIALLGAYTDPDYFEGWTPKQLTPWGRLERYIKAGDGVWFVQAGGTWGFAVYYAHFGLLPEWVHGRQKVNPHAWTMLAFGDSTGNLRTVRL